MRVAYLGPPGTFSEEALRASLGDEAEPVAVTTVYDAIRAVEDGEAELALVPFENSIEGSVRATLDTLAFETRGRVAIIGELDFPIRHSLIARAPLELEWIEAVISHPQPIAQCATFCRMRLPQAQVRAATSTAEAVRMVSESDAPWAALGPSGAAERYGCVVLAEGVEDHPDNVTRFIWVGGAEAAVEGGGSFRTTLVFSELGADHPGALVEALEEFSSRSVNLTRIESRPLRRGLGRYMFFVDLEGSISDPTVAEAIAALEGKAENVRVLGSYPVGVIPSG